MKIISVDRYARPHIPEKEVNAIRKDCTAETIKWLNLILKDTGDYFRLVSDSYQVKKGVSNCLKK